MGINSRTKGANFEREIGNLLVEQLGSLVLVCSRCHENFWLPPATETDVSEFQKTFSFLQPKENEGSNDLIVWGSFLGSARHVGCPGWVAFPVRAMLEHAYGIRNNLRCPP